MNAGLFETKSMKQFYEVSSDPNTAGRFLPDRYVEGTCPACDSTEARGDQCDACGATYEAIELKNPISKMNPDSSIEIRDTEHMFYRLDLFQNVLEEHASLNIRNEVKCPRYDKTMVGYGAASKGSNLRTLVGISLPMEE